MKVVWFAAWLGVVLLGIDVGLGVGVVVALAVVLYKSSRFAVVFLTICKSIELRDNFELAHVTSYLILYFQIFRPPATLLGQIPNTGIYRDLQRIPSVSTVIILICEVAIQTVVIPSLLPVLLVGSNESTIALSL